MSMNDQNTFPAPGYRPEADYSAGGLGGTLRYALALIRRNIVLIGLIVAAVLAVAVVVTMLTTPRYTATATLQINDQSDEVLGDALESETTSNSSWDVERFLNTQIEILRSREVAERVADSLNLASDPAFFAAMGVEAPGDGLPVTVRREMAIGMLRGGMSAALPYETRIATISFESTNPEYSARIANAFAEQFIQSSLQRRYDSSSYARNFIADQLQEARVRLEASERELNAYARQAGLIRSRSTGDEESSGSAGSVTGDSLNQLNLAANNARAARIAAEARWQAEQAQPLLSSPSVTSNQTVQTLLGRRADLDAKIDNLGARYLDDYPPLVQYRAERAQIDKQLREVATSVRDGVRAEYAAALSAESSLAGQVANAQNATLAEQDRSVRYNTLAREADTNRSIYDGLLQRFRSLNASAGITSSNLAIVDKAQVPGGPSSPNLFRNLILAFIIGIGIAGVVVFLRDQLDDAIRVPEDVESKLTLPLLGVVPAAAGGDLEDELADPKSPMAEAYSSLRGQLLYSTANGLPGILLVTSSQPSEGKSTTSTAIAEGFARMGKRVVLVDADLRRPSVHKRHGLPNEHGLSGLLTGMDTLNERTIQPVADNFDIIGSGPLPPSPTELLTGPRLAALLQDLAARYDLVVLDSPPVLGLADAPVMSALADGVIFVVEADRGRGGMLKTAIRRLRAINPVILGAVLTKFAANRGSNKYSEYYGYEYYRYNSADHASD